MKILKLTALLLTATPSGASLFIHDMLGMLGKLNISTGEVEAVGNMGIALTDIAFNSSGELYGLDLEKIYRINPMTGQLTVIGDHGIPSGNALVFDLEGRLLAAGGRTGNLYQINLNSGIGTVISNIGHYSAGDLAFKNGKLYLTTLNNQLVRIAVAPYGSGTVVGDLGFPDVFSLAIAEDRELYGVSVGRIIKIDADTGAGQFISDIVKHPPGNIGFHFVFGSSSYWESALQTPTISRNENGQMKLVWRGALGGSFAVETCARLGDKWTRAEKPPEYVSEGYFMWIDEQMNAETSRFYRVSSEN